MTMSISGSPVYPALTCTLLRVPLSPPQYVVLFALRSPKKACLIDFGIKPSYPSGCSCYESIDGSTWYINYAASVAADGYEYFSGFVSVDCSCYGWGDSV